MFPAREDYHVAASDDETRGRTIVALQDTVDLCTAIGDDVVVFGSPAQRSIPDGRSHEEAWERAVDLFADAEFSRRWRRGV